MPLFVVLKHIKLSNLIMQKSTTNKESRMSDQYDNIYTHAYSLMITYKGSS